MPKIDITSQAYEIVSRQAQQTKRSPEEIASQLITTNAAITEHPYVEQREGVLGGKPVIKGTRLPIWQIAERLY